MKAKRKLKEMSKSIKEEIKTKKIEARIIDNEMTEKYISGAFG